MSPAPSDTLFAEIIDFLASAPTQAEIIAYKPPQRLEQRLEYLMEQNRRDTLSADEREELDEFIRINHLMNMVKIRARQKLAEA